MVRLLKYNIDSINIYPFGGITKIEKNINTRIYHNILISLSGITFQYFVIKYICNLNIFSEKTIFIINSYNKVIILFNILPIIPLDGSKFLESLLNYFFSYKKSFYITILVSILSIIIFFFYATTNSLNSFLIITLLIFYTLKYYKDFKYLFNKFLLERILYNFSYRKIINTTKRIDDLKIECKHFFKKDNVYINEEQKIREKFVLHKFDKKC